MFQRALMMVVAVGLWAAVASAQTSSPADSSATHSASREESPRAPILKNAAIGVLRKRVERVEWSDQPLELVIEWLRQQGDANVVVNWNAMSFAGVERESLVTLSMRNTSVAEVLNEVLEQMAQDQAEPLRYRGVGNTIRISTARDFDRKLYLRVYDGTDLLFKIPSFTDAPEIDLQQQQQSGGQGGGGQSQPVFTTTGGSGEDERGGEQDREIEERIKQLRELIEDSIEPDVWDINGGKATVRAFNKQLVIRAPIEVHEQIAGLFVLD
jgi:hypothetical protein